MPTVISDQERVRRVREEGSRRQRDLAAVGRVEAAEVERAAAEERERLAMLGPIESAAMRAEWDQLLARIFEAVPSSTFKIWFSPLRFAGAVGTTLVLAAPDGIHAWLERRYSSLIREALEGTGYTEVKFVSAGEGATCR